MKKILFFLVLMIFSLLLCTIAFAAEEQTVYISATGNENATGSIDSPFDSFYSAVRALPNGGTVVLLDTIILPATKIPESYGLITITSKDGDNDYRTSNGGNAKLFISGNVTLSSAVKFENIDISTTKKNLVFLCNGNYACFGEGLTVSAGASDANLPSIAAGCSGATPANGTYLEVHSGSWFRVRGGSRGTTSATQKGDISVVIYGGTFTSTFDIGGDSATEGNANLYIFDGMFTASANGASGTDIGGDVYVSIYGGRFSKTFSVSRGGNIGGNVTVNVLSDTVKSISLGTGKVSGTKTAN
ncbi:MAG: hypothetical protein IKU61_05990, partial [Clostridia bacterium]|nr:hypothetical protein [Clostridia bacterium]